MGVLAAAGTLHATVPLISAERQYLWIHGAVSVFLPWSPCTNVRCMSTSLHRIVWFGLVSKNLHIISVTLNLQTHK